MGDDSIVYTCFEFKDKWANKICLYLEEKTKSRTLTINEKEFDLTKPLARKIVKEIVEEFNLKEFANSEKKE